MGIEGSCRCVADSIDSYARLAVALARNEGGAGDQARAVRLSHVSPTMMIRYRCVMNPSCTGHCTHWFSSLFVVVINEVYHFFSLLRSGTGLILGTILMV